MKVDKYKSIVVDYNYLVDLNNKMINDDNERKNIPMIILPEECNIFDWMNPEVKYDENMPSQKILIFNRKGKVNE